MSVGGCCFLFLFPRVIHTIESREKIINLIDHLARYPTTESGTNRAAIFK